MPTDESIALFAELGHQISVLMERVQALEAENHKLKELLKKQGTGKGSKAPIFAENYSVERNQGEGKSKRGRQSTGRRSQSIKLELVSEHINVYETGVSQSSCVERRVQFGWRFIKGQATYVCYHIYAQPESKQLPDVPVIGQVYRWIMSARWCSFLQVWS